MIANPPYLILNHMVTFLIHLNAIVAFHPVERHRHTLCQAIQLFPVFLVFHRFVVRRLPALPFPGSHPYQNAVLYILAVRIDDYLPATQLTRILQRFDDCGKLHLVVGRHPFAAGQFRGEQTIGIQRERPAPRTGIAAATTVRVDVYLSILHTRMICRELEAQVSRLVDDIKETKFWS